MNSAAGCGIMAAFLVRGTTPLNMMQDKENGKMSKVKKTGENGGGGVS